MSYEDAAMPIAGVYLARNPSPGGSNPTTMRAHPPPAARLGLPPAGDHVAMPFWRRKEPAPAGWVGQAADIRYATRATGDGATRVDVRLRRAFDGHPVYVGLVLKEWPSAEPGAGWTLLSSMHYSEADGSDRTVHGNFLLAPERHLLSRLPGGELTLDAPVPAGLVAGGLFQSMTNRAWVATADGIVPLLDHKRIPALQEYLPGGMEPAPNNHELDLRAGPEGLQLVERPGA